uniref:unconventional myosin-XIX isoform X2 n=1 Tax=Ciona intestinalis TaxID=7719 RepID=UPI00089DB576|nr:unconventional myosin-XIX isoform X2 [Ciona intestinalis]|eukprot:XP_018669557.1 unconventional myosin-XIX isoform X2 [Ciona intestinalis]
MKFQKGMLIWADHPDEVWQPARVVEVLQNKQIKVEYFSGGTKLLKASKNFYRILSMENIEENEIENDLSKLGSLSTPSVLHAIRKAYHSGVYYSNLGAGTILAVNPFQEVSNLFDEKKINNYHLSPLSELSCMPAHVFGVAERALRNMKDGNDQSIIISGESGAGKTWTVRCLMRYLATVNLHHAQLNLSDSFVGDEIEHRVLSSNPILEAFGNAATPRNHNSSRFGKYIQLQYDRCGTMVGANLQVYLLEKTRVSSRDDLERSYHIFYQMINGSSEEERREWKLPDVGFMNKDFREQNVNSNNSVKPQHNGSGDSANSFNQSMERMDDESAFDKTRKSMMSVGIFTESQNRIFATLSAILHLNQLDFEGDDDLSTPCTIPPCLQSNVKTSSQLLAVPINHLVQTLTVRKIEAGSTRSADRRRSVFKRPCTRVECRARRDAMVKCMYERLFLWLVKQIGNDLSAQSNAAYHFIGLLDVYGFESFKHNCLEQLCINYANEKLQQYYIHNFLKLKQEELALEGVSWEGLDVNDKINCLISLEANRSSLFALLNEECRLNRTTNPQQLQARLTDSFHKNPYITQPRISTDTPSFTVNHYAGKVVYSVELLIMKNKDELPQEIRELLLASSNQFVQDLMLDKPPNPDAPTAKGKSLETVLSQFKRSLDELLATMSSTNCNYIRCIKPNIESLPSKFDSRHVVEQLRSSGVVKTIQICGSLHPHQLSYQHFISHYIFMLPTTNSATYVKCYSQLNLKKSQKICRKIINHVLVDQTQLDADKCWQFGKTCVFLSADLYELLQTKRDEQTTQSVLKIQRAWRFHTQRKFCRLLIKHIVQRRLKAVVTLQRHWRIRTKVRRCRKIRRLKIIARNKAVCVIQRGWGRFKLRKQREKAALVIQRAFQNWKKRKYTEKEKDNENDDYVSYVPVVTKMLPLHYASVRQNDSSFIEDLELDSVLSESSVVGNLTNVKSENSLNFLCELLGRLSYESKHLNWFRSNLYQHSTLHGSTYNLRPVTLFKLYYLVCRENDIKIPPLCNNNKTYEKKFIVEQEQTKLPILPFATVVPVKGLYT